MLLQQTHFPLDEKKTQQIIEDSIKANRAELLDSFNKLSEEDKERSISAMMHTDQDKYLGMMGDDDALMRWMVKEFKIKIMGLSKQENLDDFLGLPKMNG